MAKTPESFLVDSYICEFISKLSTADLASSLSWNFFELNLLFLGGR